MWGFHKVRKRSIHLPIIVFCILLSGIVPYVSAVDVTGPVVITSPGEYYLKTDILNSTNTTIIDIRSSDVLFDGEGHLINGAGNFTAGINVRDSDRVTVKNVSVQNFWIGMFFANTSGSSVVNSTVRYNSIGINLYQCSSGLVSNNTIADNEGIGGLSLSESQNNSISDNLFNNTENVNTSSSVPSDVNTWNLTKRAGPNIINGSFIGGNFWGDPLGTGYSQTCSDVDRDGFCDLPYTLTSNNTDYLPLCTSEQILYIINASAGTGGSICPSGEVGIFGGTDVTFGISPDDGYDIGTVTVDNLSQGAVDEYTFTDVMENHIIHAGFTVSNETWYISASAGSGGSISPSGLVPVPYGQNQNFTVNASPGYSISDVLVNSVSLGSQTSPFWYTFTNVTGNQTIAASFSLANETSFINASAGSGGSISPSGLVPVLNGQNQSFTVNASPCYTISDILVNSVSLGSQASPFQYTFTNITSNKTISGQFARIIYPISVTAGTGGTITPSGVVNVSCGADQQFAITPNAGYQTASVVVDGLNVGQVSNYTFSAVQASHQISASFMPVITNYEVNATADPYTIISPHGIVTSREGENKTFITQAKPGSDLLDVLVDTNSSGRVGSWTFTNITRNHTISTLGEYTPGQVQVLFTMNQTWGPVPLAVQFTDQSAGSPTSFYWQFGDGETSTSQNPVHRYESPGTFSVTLRAINNMTGGVGILNNGITVTSGYVPQPTPTPVPGPISAAFNATPMNGTGPLYVSFQDGSTGNPISWTWDFGDGNLSVLQNPAHLYSRAGSYSVTLLAQNANYGGILSRTGYITVT